MSVTAIQPRTSVGIVFLHGAPFEHLPNSRHFDLIEEGEKDARKYFLRDQNDGNFVVELRHQDSINVGAAVMLADGAQYGEVIFVTPLSTGNHLIFYINREARTGRAIKAAVALCVNE